MVGMHVVDPLIPILCELKCPLYLVPEPLRDISLTTGGGGSNMLGKICPRNSVIPPIKRVQKCAKI